MCNEQYRCHIVVCSFFLDKMIIYPVYIIAKSCNIWADEYSLFQMSHSTVTRVKRYENSTEFPREQESFYSFSSTSKFPEILQVLRDVIPGITPVAQCNWLNLKNVKHVRKRDKNWWINSILICHVSKNSLRRSLQTIFSSILLSQGHTHSKR